MINEISIVNILGQTVLKQKANSITSHNSMEAMIDLTNYQNGVYYIIISYKDGGQMIEKIIKSN